MRRSGPMHVTPYDVARQYVGVKERPGPDLDHPLISYWLSLCKWFDLDTDDEVPWCSAYIHGCLQPLGLLHLGTGLARARSWLKAGSSVELAAAVPGWDLLVLKRGGPGQPGPEVLDAVGHVTWFAGRYTTGRADLVLGLGGNQGDEVNVRAYPVARLLDVRRLVA